MLKKIQKLLLLQRITTEKLELIEDNLPSLKSKIENQTTHRDVDYELDFDGDFPLKDEKDLHDLEKKINDKSVKIQLVNSSQNKYYSDNHTFRIVGELQLEQLIILYMRRFTSTVPARGARAPNRAISNSCL